MSDTLFKTNKRANCCCRSEKKEPPLKGNEAQVENFF